MSTRAWSVILFLALALAVPLAAPAPAGAATLADCTEASLRAAIQAVNDGGTDTTINFPAGPCTITIGAGTLPGDEDANAEGDFDVLATMTIVGANANLSIVDGGGLHRCFDVNPLASPNVTFTMRNVTVRNCDATTDTGNKNGGGLIASSATVVLDNVRFTGNKAQFGGGLRDDNSNITITNSTFDGNTANAGVSLGDGGGLWLDVTQDTLTNVTISGNTATADGGGLLHNAGPLTINNVTIAGNTANRGGGVFADTGTSTLSNSIIAQNTGTTNGPDCFAGAPLITSQGNNVVGDITDCSFTPAAGDQTAVAGAVVAATLAPNGGQTPTHALATGSAALNNGSNTTCASADQRGVPRPQGANCDSGAYEQLTSQVVLSAAPITKSGSNVTFNATVANPGSDTPADVYVFVLVPQLTLSPGCAAGNSVVFIGPGNSIVPGCLTDHPSTFTKNRTVTVPGGLPTVTVPVATVNAAGVAGTFTGGILLSQPNGLLDGISFAPVSVPGGDLEGVAVSAFTLP